MNTESRIETKAKLSDDNFLNSSSWRKWSFWRDIFLYYWIFALAGHILELIWGGLGVLTGLRSLESFQTIPVIAVAAPYGFGAVILHLTVYPLVQQRKLKIVGTFLISMFLMTAVEFLCALFIFLVTGHNAFWDYSNRFMNLFGFVCLGNSLLFGLASVLAVNLVFPPFDKLLDKISNSWRNWIYAAIFPSYITIQIVHLAVGL